MASQSLTPPKVARPLTTSPILTLPVEITVEIFQLYCEAYRTFPGHPTHPEIILTHVCRHWHEISTSLPALWRHLVLSPQSSPNIVALYLQRSEGLPLDLNCNLRYHLHDVKSRARALQLWELVAASSSRWQRLITHFEQRDISTIMAQLGPLAGPILEDLQLISSNQYKLSDGLIFQGGLPLLKELHLTGVLLHQLPSVMPGITRLVLNTMTPMSFSAFRDIIHGMPNLEQLDIEGCVVDEWFASNDPNSAIAIPSLRILRIAERQWPLTAPLLSIFAENLDTLSLCDADVCDLPNPAEEPRISSNFPKLRALVFAGNSYFDRDSFATIHRIFPTAEELVLENVGESFIDDFTSSMEDASLWPGLRSIKMGTLASEDSLCCLIEARAGTESPLEKLVVPDGTALRRLNWLQTKVKVESYEDYATCKSLSGVSPVIPAASPLLLTGLPRFVRV
ncbi:hypothetical protein BDQ17DRAFT_320970 [Cyathus striatus]|nr:hypothetical protein BDQ17DRAFT_320970 [Cyathus striatus]